ncbi:double-strand break repair helicase AddA [Aquamicrobium sp. LC103]|uniref:double-strand break repair helicase AddA n=1 Tax=Aquamicrobium sp. LC103 TaxID=1120658 RepID=UPI00063E7A30|nr:double-strand break repair helicase AddA [Aquamicrobium sp. LC103]TKT82770.1 double-strand break repair helicase AddA [Aquamicrobium sp. LC103]
MRKSFVVPQETVERQARASDPRSSVWVSANAGSGKTHVLSQRVIRLLLEGTDPSRILCLTYTRAAAANMANRVFSSLARWTMLPDDELAGEIEKLDGRPPSARKIQRARQLFASALETPGGLKIQTIHAFCEAVLHQFPLEANIAGHFEMLDNQMEAALVAEARREMIAGAAEGQDPALAEAFATVLQLGGEFGLETLLGEVVAKRDGLRRFISAIGDGDPRFHPLFGEFGFSGRETPAAILAEVWPDGYFDARLARALTDRAHAAGKVKAADFGADLAAACALSGPDTLLDALRPLFMTRKNGQWTAKSTKALMAKGVGEHFPGFAEEFERFATAIDAACDRAALLNMLQGTRAALVIADWLIARYERLKSARGFLDFNDLITRTVALLGRKDSGAWVQYKLDRGIDHILLDEAQDTSPDQWNVVKNLAAEFFAGKGAREGVERTIFAVGDEKQSIYSFQGAEPEAFDISGREFSERVRAAESRFEHVRLTRSFRSTDDVLSAVDLVFSREETRKGLTRDPEPIAHRAVRENDPGYVELWPSLSPEVVEEPEDWTTPIDHASAPAVRLARQIAATLRRWLDTGERIEGTGKRLSAGDVMVLVRKRDRFIHALTRELKNCGIPVAGADRLVLAGHIAVQDLMAIGRFVLQPEDDLSLAAVLKSPVFGLGEETLFRLAAERPRSLFAALRQAAENDDALKAVLDQLVAWRDEAGYRPAFEFYAGLLARDGLRRRMIARLGHEAGDVVDEFLNFCLAAEKSGVAGLEPLLALLEGGGPEIKREMDQTRGEVRIMTAHAAKGLEAPVVFLVDSGSAAFSESHLPRLMPFDPPRRGWRGPGYLWRAAGDMTNKFSRELARTAREKAEQEYRRLLYVGMTRAEDRLVVCGYHGKRGPSDMTWHAIVRDALSGSQDSAEHVHPVSGARVLRYRVTPLRAIEEGKAEEGARAELAAMPAALTRPLPAPPRLPRPLSPSGAAALIEPERELGRAKGSPVLDEAPAASFAIERGLAVHRLLQMLPALAEAERVPAAMRYIARIGKSWHEADRERLLGSVEAVLREPRFAPIFAQGSRAEVTIMGTVKLGAVERAVSGKIDRLAATDREVLVVDYKTNRPPPAGLREVPGGYVAQLALYRELLAPLYPGRRISAALLFTEKPILIEVPAEAMDDALVRLTRA